MDFSWVTGTLRGWTALAWWAILPVRAVAMILSIVADLIFIAIFAGIVALWAGMIPDAQVRSVLDQVGHKVESYVLPEFRAALHPTSMSPTIPDAAVTKPSGVSAVPVPPPMPTGGVDALMSDHPGIDTGRKTGAGE